MNIIQMARDAGALIESWMTNPPSPGLFYMTTEQIERFAALAIAYEREECARVCDAEFWIATKRDGGSAGVAAGNCAVAIRARGDKP